MLDFLSTTNIPVGKYVTTKVFGLTMDLDTIWGAAIAGILVIALGLAVRRSATAEVPGKIQLFWESVLGTIRRQVEQNLGPNAGPIVPLAVTLFVFILLANWLEVLPTGGVNVALPSPTADANLPYAMAFFVFLVYNIASIRYKGLGGFFRRVFHKPWALVPLNLLEEVIKPITLSLRLFGNLLSGGLMIALLAALFPFWISWAPTVLWKAFDMFIGVIQAFIFSLLTILYYQSAVGPEGH